MDVSPDCPIYQHDVFKTREFQEFRVRSLAAISKAVDPGQTSINTLAPIISTSISNLTCFSRMNFDAIHTTQNEILKRLDALGSQSRNNIIDFQVDMAAGRIVQTTPRVGNSGIEMDLTVNLRDYFYL